MGLFVSDVCDMDHFLRKKKQAAVRWLEMPNASRIEFTKRHTEMCYQKMSAEGHSYQFCLKCREDRAALPLLNIKKWKRLVVIKIGSELNIASEKVHTVAETKMIADKMVVAATDAQRKARKTADKEHNESISLMLRYFMQFAGVEHCVWNLKELYGIVCCPVFS